MSPNLSIFHFILFSSILQISTSETLFNFTSFKPNTPSIDFDGDAFANSDKTIQLTRNEVDNDLRESVGRVTYALPIQIWDPKTKVVSDFCTHFTFIINGLNKDHHGDGLTFFMAPVGSHIPMNSTGKWLGLFNSTTSNSSSTNIVAVEFDTFQNEWDPSDNHIGIDVNSIVSVNTTTWQTNIRNGSMGSAWVGYNSTGKNLYVYLTYDIADYYNGYPSLSYKLDLTELLPDNVIVGFSASTGSSTELHKILYWDFVSWAKAQDSNLGKKKAKLVYGIVIIAGLLIAGLGIGMLYWQLVKRGKGDERALDASIEHKFVKGTGPRRFSYKELALATNNFSEEGKLGQGGFGGVYKGKLNKEDYFDQTVAVKKISRGSSQGKKEYVSEVTVISRLRHRNLVKLIGWCHEKKEFLLVYEFMPNGSLDTHLFGKKSTLKWGERYKIALGLASGLLYLHEEWEQCVVHRDIKSSNVMLDSYFNAKLGDFGLARFVDHELGSQTTVLAGTMGYVAPECVTTGKASKESDVYSFGVVALEIACGKKPVVAKAPDSVVRLVEWVWGLYGTGRLLEAVDERLGDVYDERQMERLLVAGLWCAHPDQKARPSIRQAIQVMKFEAPMPRLPGQMPVAYYAPPLCMRHFDYTTTNSGTSLGMRSHNIPCCCSNCRYTLSTSSSRNPSAKSLMGNSPTQLLGEKELQRNAYLLR